MNKLHLAIGIIVGLGIAYYWQYNYNEAKDTMSMVMPKFMLAYTQPSENWTIVPSHELNGELLFNFNMIQNPPSDYKPDLNTLQWAFDINNATNMKFDPESLRFYIDLNSTEILWNGIVEVQIDSSTRLNKTFDMELTVNNVSDEGSFKVFLAEGVLKKGNQIWNSITAAIGVSNEGDILGMSGNSYVDHVPSYDPLS